MKTDKRRYFRIHDCMGLSYHRLGRASNEDIPPPAGDLLGLLTAQDEAIQQLLKLSEGQPELARLASTLKHNQHRINTQLALDNDLMRRLAHRLRDVSISACGVAFASDAAIDAGTKLQLSLELLPGDQTVRSKGTVVGCEPIGSGFYWRVEFYDMHAVAQETLIQHIVQRQFAQLKMARSHQALKLVD